MNRISSFFACVPMLALAMLVPRLGIAEDPEFAYVGLRKCATCHKK